MIDLGGSFLDKAREGVTQAQFTGLLINGRHRYSADLKAALPENYRLRV